MCLFFLPGVAENSHNLGLPPSLDSTCVHPHGSHSPRADSGDSFAIRLSLPLPVFNSIHNSAILATVSSVLEAHINMCLKVHGTVGLGLFHSAFPQFVTPQMT